MFKNMNPEWKEKWITALRSGDYSQGVGNLMGEEDTFCCLGVLCDIYNPDGWDSVMPMSAYSFGYSGDDEGDLSVDDRSDFWDNTHSETELPESFAAHLGISSGEQQTVIAFNDAVEGVRNPLGIHLTFSEIADIVEYGVLPNKAIA